MSETPNDGAGGEGEKLLSAVERILASDAAIRGIANECLREARDIPGRDEPAIVAAAADLAIGRYSNHAMLSGAATALPGLLPGLGSLAALTGGALVDMGLLLKFEVEMSLCISAIHGFDIASEPERRIAFLLAAVSTYDARQGDGALSDFAAAERVAIENYAPREVTKLLISVMTKLSLSALSRGFLKALPLVGIAVGGAVNKVLSERVGKRLREEFRRRRADLKLRTADVVEARVRDEVAS